MMKRALAIALALVMLLAVVPVSAGAASKNTGKVKMKSSTVSVTKDGVMLNIRWKKVSKAEGYEYAYNLFYTKDSTESDYTFKSTDGTSAAIRLKDYGNIDIRVRAWRTVNGKKVYGRWANGRIKRSKADSMVVKQLKKQMKSHPLFMKVTSKTVSVRANAGEKYGVVATANQLDEMRATGKFKRDGSGVWWAQVYASIDQNTTVKGWVSRKDTDPVWY